MTKMAASSPWLLNDEGTRFVGIVHPDGTESEFTFAEPTKAESKPAPKQAEHGSAPGHTGGHTGGAHGKSEVQ